MLFVRTDPQVPAPGEFRLRWLSPTGAQLGEATGAIELGTYIRVRALTRIDGLSLVGPGWYQWEVAFRSQGAANWTDAASVPVEVVLSPA